MAANNFVRWALAASVMRSLLQFTARSSRVLQFAAAGNCPMCQPVTGQLAITKSGSATTWDVGIRYALNALFRLLVASSRLGRGLLAAAIIGGVLVPPIAHALRGTVPVAVVGLSTLVFLRVDVPATLAHLHRPRRLAAVLAVQMVSCPLLAWSAIYTLLDVGITDAVVLFATGSAIVSAPAYARLPGLLAHGFIADDDTVVGWGVPAALFQLQPVQALRYAERPQGGDRRRAVTPG
jgi:hypothetical protein